MIAAWLLYATAVSAVLAVAALVLERALTLYRVPTRFVWAGAMVGSILLPLLVRLWPARDSAPMPVADQGISILPAAITMPANAVGVVSTGAPNLDTLLLVGWGFASGAMLVWLAWSLWRLGRERDRWTPSWVDGVPVMVSRDEGPAIVGLLPATIVIPHWLLDTSPETQRLALLHEREHLRASDTRLLLFAMVCVALAPWNLALWWQAHRLRVAVEVDCDRRVLRSGVEPRAYADLLLRLSERTLPTALARPALAEPKSLLSRRIAGMLPLRIRARLLRAVTYGAVAIGLVVLACDAPAPEEPVDVPTDASAAGTTWDGSIGYGTAVLEEDVDQEPVRITCPIPQYPQLLKKAGIEGEVLLQAIVNREGNVDPGSIEVLESSHQAFEAPSEALLSACTFEPGLVDDEPVPVIIQMPIAFRLGTGSDSGNDWIALKAKTRVNVTGEGALDDPLLIVDGVIIGDRSMIDVDALDIESIEVIKGQTAESLYGERAKNGVVQITTKK